MSVTLKTLVALTIASGAGASVVFLAEEDPAEKSAAVVGPAEPAPPQSWDEAYQRAAHDAAQAVCTSGCDVWRVFGLRR